jgi:dTDP-4-amino-4,6-dideoxygalactose transaminase
MSATGLSQPPLAFVDLRRQQETIRRRIDSAIARVLDHGQYILGPEVQGLEVQLAAFCGIRHAITCGSGTDALLMALMAQGLQPGQAVVVPSFTFAATAEVVCLLGGIPVFADVQKATFNLDADSLKMALLTARHLGLAVAGVISVDLFGQPCLYDTIVPVIEENKLWLICDAAQSFGASYRGRPVGHFGAMTATSFFPAKPLGCYGDGGAVLTDDSSLAGVLRSLRVHGQGENKYDNVRIGINGRLDTIQAAVLLEKLAIFESEIAARERAASRYDAILPEAVWRPVRGDGTTSVWAQYTVAVAARDQVADGLKARGVPAMIYYPVPLHLQPAYRGYPCTGNGLPVSTQLAASVLSLPMHPYLTEDDQQRVADEIARLL